jgi:hypothetical protein
MYFLKFGRLLKNCFGYSIISHQIIINFILYTLYFSWEKDVGFFLCLWYIKYCLLFNNLDILCLIYIRLFLFYHLKLRFCTEQSKQLAMWDCKRLTFCIEPEMFRNYVDSGLYFSQLGDSCSFVTCIYLVKWFIFTRKPSTYRVLVSLYIDPVLLLMHCFMWSLAYD